MNIHNYSALTGEYLSTEQADSDPLEDGKFLIPANATTTTPPSAQQGQARVFANGSWSLVPDHRGEVWYAGFGQPVTISELGTPDGLTVTEPAKVLDEDDVINERKRRLATGFNFDFEDSRGVHRIGTTEADLAGWREVTDFAQASINSGGGDSAVIGIVTDTGAAQITPNEWQVILLAAGAFRQPIFSASFLLQSMNPIPADYADDSYWP